MRRTIFLLMTALAFCAFARSAQAQFFTPKTIQFKGADGYSDAEMLATSGLKKGVLIDSTKLTEYGQHLMDTGLFANLTYKCNGQDLIYELTPSTMLVSVKLDNFPFTKDEDINAKLNSIVPLFHGKVPAEGGLAEDVRKALEQILTTDGVTATVESATDTKGLAMVYTIASPPVLVGEIKLASGSAALEPGAQQILATLTGSAYHLEGSSSQIITYLGNYYRDKGYVEAAATVQRNGAATFTQEAIKIPLEVTVTPGIQYRLGTIQLAPDIPVTQDEFQSQSKIHAGDIAEGQRLTDDWIYIARQFHFTGHMKPSVHPEPVFDRAKGVVNYTVTADPGAVYTMGKLSVDNVSDDLRAAMLAAWKLPAGAVFDERAPLRLFAIGDANATLKRVFASVNCRYKLTVNDESKTVDVVLRLEQRH
jgi:outer membrane protein insertion porin family